MVILSLTFSGKNPPGIPITGTNFIPSQMLMSNDGLGGIAVNEQTTRICLLKNQPTPPRLFHFSQLVGSFLVHNGKILGEGLRTRPSSLVSFQKVMHPRLEQLIESWQTTASPQDNQRIDLIVLIHDEEDPLHAVNFLDMETKKGGILWEKALGTATHWHNLLDNLIREANHQAHLQSEPDQNATNNPLMSVPDEWEKSGDLVEKNGITPEEFTAQKEKLPAAKP
jgi:hypothetical protein